MRLFTAMLLIPLAIIISFVFALPGGSGIVFGLVSVVAYFLVMTVRASDWR